MLNLFFYALSGTTVWFAFNVILAASAIRSLFCLIGCFFSAAGLLVLLNAEFNAMLLVIVYVGAIAVLFLFAIMLLDLKHQEHSLKTIITRNIMCIVATSVIIFAIPIISNKLNIGLKFEQISTNLPNTQSLGLQLYTYNILNLQCAGLILLVAMVGAIVLLEKQKRRIKRQNITQQINMTKKEAVCLQEVETGKGVEC